MTAVDPRRTRRSPNREVLSAVATATLARAEQRGADAHHGRPGGDRLL
jgi:hypothetical protein